MKQDKLDTPLSVLLVEVPARHNEFTNPDYHQFVYIKSGKGSYETPELSTSFSSGDLFLVRKNEIHAFHFDEENEVYFIKFQEATRRKLKGWSEQLKGLAVPPQKARSPLNLKVSFPPEELDVVNKLFEYAMLLSKQVTKNEGLIYFQMMSLVTLIERNLYYAPTIRKREIKPDDIRFMMKYIHKNLKSPNLLTLNNLAEKFNMSINKLGQYFKAQTGQTVKQFVTTSRMTVIAEQVKSGTISFSEIAFEFGFVDESHFNKTFKKHFGKSPTEWRKG